MDAEQAAPVPGPSGTEAAEGQGPNQEDAAIPPRRSELHPIGIEKSRSVKLEPSFQEMSRKRKQEAQLQKLREMEDEDANVEKLMKMEKEYAEGWNRRQLDSQVKQAAALDQILKATGANLKPDCSHPRFPVMFAERDNGNSVSISSVKEFNKVRKEECEREPREKRRRMEEWRREIGFDPEEDDSDSDDEDEDEAVAVVVGEDADEDDDDNDADDLLEQMNAPPPRRGRFLEAMMRDIIRDDEAHPDRFRGQAPDGVPNIMQRLANLQERQDRQREQWRREREEGPAAALDEHIFFRRLGRRDQ